MVRIVYIEHDGTEHDVDLPSGTSVMAGARQHGLPGIDGDCGGECACATCHVYVDEAWRSEIGQISETEEMMLELVEQRSADSRLSCQILLSGKLDGLVVRLPASQV